MTRAEEADAIAGEHLRWVRRSRYPGLRSPSDVLASIGQATSARDSWDDAFSALSWHWFYYGGDFGDSR